VEPFDVVEDIRPCLCTGLILPPIDALALEHSEEAFGGCIVRAASHAAHAALKLVPLQEALVFVTRKLGEFNRSSQHLKREKLRWGQSNVGGLIARYVHRCVHRVVRPLVAASIDTDSGKESLAA
jgi:hypothetical protein